MRLVLPLLVIGLTSCGSTSGGVAPAMTSSIAATLLISPPLSVEAKQAKFRITLSNAEARDICVELPALDYAGVEYVDPRTGADLVLRLGDMSPEVPYRRVQVPALGQVTVEGFSANIDDFLVREENGDLGAYMAGSPLAVRATWLVFPCTFATFDAAEAAAALTVIQSDVSEPFVLGRS